MCSRPTFCVLSASVWAFRFSTFKATCSTSRTWASFKHLKTWKRSTCLTTSSIHCRRKQCSRACATYSSSTSTITRSASGKTCRLWLGCPTFYTSHSSQTRSPQFPAIDTSSLTLFPASKLSTTTLSRTRSALRMLLSVTASEVSTNTWSGTSRTIVTNLALNSTNLTSRWISIA